MASDPPPQPVLAGRNLRAQLFAISGNEGFELLAKMQGLTGDGAEILMEEPASPAIAHPGDLLLSILYEGRFRMAYISKVDVGGEVGSEDGGSSSTVAAEDEKDGGSSSTDAAEDEEDGGGSSTDAAEDEEDGGGSGTDAAEDEEDGDSTSTDDTEDEEHGGGSGTVAAEDEEDGDSTSTDATEDEEGGASDSLDATEEEEEEEEQLDDGSSRTDPKDEEEWGSTNTENEEGNDKSGRSSTGSSCSSLVAEAEDNEMNRRLQIRLWPEYCVLALFEGESWKLTKQQPIQWLQEQQIEEIYQRTMTENETIEIDMTNNLAFVDLSKPNCILGFTGFLECSEDVENFINTELNPDIINYNINKVLGRGASCKVYAVDTEYAMKKMNLTKKFDDKDALKRKEPREIIILSSFRRSAVVSFFQAWAVDGIFKSYLEGSSDGSRDLNYEETESDDELEDGAIPRYLAIQMEYCSRTLRKFLDDQNREIDVEKSWFIFKEIVKGVQFIHRSGVIHRDLKPENIFFGYADPDAIKIGDFGHACWAKQYAAGEAGTPNRGTTGYCAPELDDAKTPTDKADIYSLGVIFLELFCRLGSEHERYEVLENFKAGEYPKSDWYVDVILLRKLIAVCPSERLSVDEILEYISNRIEIVDPEVQ